MRPVSLLQRVSVAATLVATLALPSTAAGTVGSAPDAAPDFVRDVQPILAGACVRCHGRSVGRAGLRLDTAAWLREGGESGAPVTPGDPVASLLIQRVTNTDPGERMPREAAPLEPAHVDTLRRWIASGAAWPEGLRLSVPEGARAALPTRPVRPATPARVGFNRDVRPILADNCYACHGPDRQPRQAGLRLDREDVAKAPLASGNVAIVAGAPEQSALLARVIAPGRAAAHAPRLERQARG